MKKLISLILCVILISSLTNAAILSEVRAQEGDEEIEKTDVEENLQEEFTKKESESSQQEISDSSGKEYQEESSAQESSIDDYTYTQANGEITITKYSGTEEIVEIPTEINAIPVTTIGKQAFYNCSTIKQLIIPYGVTTINNEAFRNCTNLETIYYDCNLKKLGSNIFRGCTKLKTAYVGEQVENIGINGNNDCFGPALEAFIVDEKNPYIQSIDGVLYRKQDDGTCDLILYPVAKVEESFIVSEEVSVISKNALSSNPYLKEVIVMGRNVAIEGMALYNLESLESISFVNAINSIERYAVSTCPNLQRISIEENIASSAPEAVSGCDSLKQINIGKNVSEFSVESFGDTIVSYEVGEGNKSFLSDEGVLYDVKDEKILLKYPSQKTAESYEIQKDTKEIEWTAFDDCKYIKEIIFSPDSEVRLNTFFWCEGLERIELTGEIVAVNGNALTGCSNLKTLILGNKITEYDNIEELSICTKLEEIQVESGNRVFFSKEGILFDRKCETLHIYPAGKKGETYTIPNTVTTIGKSAFEKCQYLTAIEIPESVTRIEENSINCTIIGVKGSEAENYALENNLPFVDKNAEGETGYPIISSGGTSIWQEGEVEEIVPEGNLYVVNTAAQLAWIAEQTLAGNDFAGKEIILAADIDLESQEWIPIGDNKNPFRGNFDGKNHKISNLLVSKSNYAGLFGAISAKTATKTVYIRNLKLANVQIEDAVAGGGLSGYVRAFKGADIQILNCTVNETIAGSEVGGLTGIVLGGENGTEIVLKNIRSNCVIENTKNGGGIIGRITSGDEDYDSYTGMVAVEDCKYNGTITTAPRSVVTGGIVGTAEAIHNGKLIIRHSRADGEISTTYTGHAGGIAGRLQGTNAQIISCVNYAELTGRGYYAGGIAGRSSGKIEQCCNEGSIAATNNGSVYGGVVGYHDEEGIIENSYNTGTIMEGIYYSYPGGITGWNYGALENCYNIGSLPEQRSSITAQCYPGAMGSTVKGETKHCYYDNLLFDLGHLYGTTSKNPDSPMIYSDPVYGIVQSGGMATAYMKTAGSYVGWDFIGIWGFDHNYSWGYPTLNSIKDLLDKHTDSDKKTLKDKKGKFTFTVVDQDNKEIAGVTVTFGEEKKETGEAGQVKFDYYEEKKGLKAEKEGYITYEDLDYTMNPTKEYTIRMIEEGKSDEYPLNSVIMDMNGNRYELLTQTKTINRKYKNVEFKIYCKPSNLEKDYVKYEILQGDYLVASSEKGEFVLTPDQFQTTEKNKVIQETKIRLTDAAGKSYEEKINLTVVDEEEITTYMEFGDGVEFAVGEDVPIFGNSKMKFDIFDLPLSVKISEEKWRVTLNLLDSEWNSGKEDGIKVLKSEYTLEQKLKKLNKYLKKEAVICQQPKISFELAGYAEGDMPIGTDEVNMQLYGKVTLKFGKEAQVYVFVFAAEVKGEISATGEMQWDMDTLKMTDGNLKIDGSVEVGLYAGIGAANIASVGIYGDPKLALGYYLLPQNESGLDEFYFEGSVKLVARVLGTNVAEHTLLGPERCWLYSRDLNEYSVDKSGKDSQYQSVEQWLQSLGDEQIEITDEQTAGEWTGNEAVLQKSAYSESKPVLLQADGDMVMLFTSNMLTNRSVEDASVLMFSVYDKQNETWGIPKPVSDDGTADFNPVVADNYVAWNNANGTLVGCKTLNERGKKQEVSIAAYNAKTQSFQNVQTVTSNQSFENNLSIQKLGETINLSWSINSQNDIFGNEGTNSVYFCTVEGNTWEIEEVSDIDKMILWKEIGELDGRTCYFYIVDENDNLADTEGQTAYAVFMDDGEKMKLSSQSMNAIYCLDEQNKVLLIGTDGNIYVKEGSEGEVRQETQEGPAVGRIQQLIEDKNGDITILFTKNGQNSANAYVLEYDAKIEQWSKLSQLTDGGNYVEGISGGYVEDRLVFLYNQREVNVNDVELAGVNSLLWNSTESSKPKLSNLQVDFYKEDAVSGQELPLEITVKNEGIGICDSIRIVISDVNKEILNKSLDVIIMPGEEKSIEVPFTVPQLSGESEYQLLVMPGENKDEAVSTRFILGEAEYKLDRSLYCINGKYKLVATVTNNGAEKGSGIVEIFDYNDPSTVYERYSFTDLANDEVLNYDTTIDSLNWEKIAYKKIGIRVMQEGKLASDIRSVTVYRDYQVPVEELRLNTTSVILEEIGSTYRLIAHVLPEEASEIRVTWKSSDEGIVSVDEIGNITAVKEGKARITATAGGKTTACDVTVKEKTLLKGDINEDGNINLIDLMLCLNHVGRKSMLKDEALTAADINEDGSVNLVDLMRLLNYVGRKTDTL